MKTRRGQPRRVFLCLGSGSCRLRDGRCGIARKLGFGCGLGLCLQTEEADRPRQPSGLVGQLGRSFGQMLGDTRIILRAAVDLMHNLRDFAHALRHLVMACPDSQVC